MNQNQAYFLFRLMIVSDLSFYKRIRYALNYYPSY